MNAAFYTGVSGLMAFQEHMDVTAHNVANTGTAGYKPQKTNFRDLMYTEMDQRIGEEKKNGHGTRVARVDTLFDQGQLNMTGRTMDYTIIGDGFFAFERNGEIKYSRNGAFGTTPEGSKQYVVSLSDGSYVLDNRGQRIELRRREDGQDGYDYDRMTGEIGIFRFANPYGLTREEGSAFKETELSGEPEDITGTDFYDLRSGTLEMSATNIGDEMINMIQAQRAYQINSKVVRTADEMEELVNNLR